LRFYFGVCAAISALFRADFALLFRAKRYRYLIRTQTFLPTKPMPFQLLTTGQQEVCTLSMPQRKGSKRFVQSAARITRDLYAPAFNIPTVTKREIFWSNVRHVLWIENKEDRTPIAATMIMYHEMHKYYRIMGLAVHELHRRQGYGAQLMRAALAMLPTGAELHVGVDTGKDSTDWLVEWYSRMGFQPMMQSHDYANEITLRLFVA
jgi:GNAT superfamily N-acetyltransferase